MKRSPVSRERGQILVIAALLLPVLLAMTGMAVDIGSYASERRSLQNAADSIALAAGQELPDAAAANNKAIEYAEENGIDTSELTISITGGSTTPAIRVTITRPHDFVFMQIVGIDEKAVGAVAAAGKFSYGGGEGIVPWSIEQDTVDAAGSGDEVVIKYDSNGPSPGNGNFGPIRIDGNGSSDYESSAKYGSDYHICSTSMSNCSTSSCPASYPTNCAEDSPECDGPECPPKTGNMTGPTKDAVDFRVDYTSSSCDSFDEAFDPASAYHRIFEQDAFGAAGEDTASTGGRLSSPGEHHGGGSHPTFTPTATRTATHTPTPVAPTNTPTRTNTPMPSNTAGPTDTPAATNTPGPTDTPAPTSTPGTPSDDEFNLNPNCNPWAAGGCATHTSVCSRRVFLIPIVDGFGNGSSDPVTILGFALVFLEGYDGSCTGSTCDIRARFVKADVTAGAFAGAYDPDASNHFVRLTE